MVMRGPPWCVGRLQNNSSLQSRYRCMNQCRFSGTFVYPELTATYQGRCSMQTTACKPVATAKPRTLRRVGMVLTHLDNGPESVFATINDPPARLARLRPVSTAFASWRDAAPLSPRFQARMKGWPVEAELRPGITVGPEQGLERWEAEKGLACLLTGDPEYVQLAREILDANDGCALELPGGVCDRVASRRAPIWKGRQDRRARTPVGLRRRPLKTG